MQSLCLPFAAAIAAAGFTFTSGVSADVNEDSRLIVQLFADYCAAKPAKKHELMTDLAFCESLGENLYAHRTTLGPILAEFGMDDFELPQLPNNYRRMPDDATVAKVALIREKLVKDLFDRLGDRKLVFYQRILELSTPTKGRSEIVDIRVSDDSQFATANIVVRDSEISFPKIPVRFAKIDGKWYFDGKDEIVLFAQQRIETNRTKD